MGGIYFVIVVDREKHCEDSEPARMRKLSPTLRLPSELVPRELREAKRMSASSSSDTSMSGSALRDGMTESESGRTPDRESQVSTMLVIFSNRELDGTAMWTSVHSGGVESARALHALHILHSRRGGSVARWKRCDEYLANDVVGKPARRGYERQVCAFSAWILQKIAVDALAFRVRRNGVCIQDIPERRTFHDAEVDVSISAGKVRFGSGSEPLGQNAEPEPGVRFWHLPNLEPEPAFRSQAKHRDILPDSGSEADKNRVC
ncbi:hypothetical protein C8J57DRAFT_1228924 [Mycena rebaudengoi]|nr:hypothetical protein C8J57DRAFT_1228924 [Mycena rebaudengoi]